MELQTLSPAASTALETAIAVLSSQLLALALQVLLDEGDSCQLPDSHYDCAEAR
jgi:hypothetical protein